MAHAREQKIEVLKKEKSINQSKTHAPSSSRSSNAVEPYRPKNRLYTCENRFVEINGTAANHLSGVWNSRNTIDTYCWASKKQRWRDTGDQVKGGKFK